MKKFVLLFTVILLFPVLIYAQCAGCLMDTTLTNTGLYPNTFPDGTQNVYYDQDVTFVMLQDTVVSGFSLSIYSYTITGISGLPPGISWQCNNSSNGCVYDPTPFKWGCVKFCGTPVQVGVFTVIITVDADVQLVGTITTQFTEIFTVLPAAGSNSSFTFNPATACDSTTVHFEALIDGAPSPTTYHWDFGNGNTSNLKFPLDQIYDTPGTYYPTLTTRIYSYVLTDVHLYSCNNNWCGDVEEPYIFGCIGDPDPYFELYDASNSLAMATNYTDNVQSINWFVDSLILSNPPYTINFWDYDPVSSNDLLGTFIFNVTGTGIYNFDSGNGTVASATIDTLIAATIVYTDTIYIYPSPPDPIISLSGNDSICAGESVTLTCSNAGSNYLQWYRDGIAISGATNSSYVAGTSGTYTLQVVTAGGCAATSALTNIIVIPLPPTPTYTINGDDLTCYLTGYSFQWYLNGNPISGATSFIYTYSQNGNYSLSVSDAFGCTSYSDTLYLIVGLQDVSKALRNISVYPNPSEGGFNLSVELAAPQSLELLVKDVTGRIIYDQNDEAIAGKNILPLDLSGFSNGFYLLEVKTTDGSWVKELLKQSKYSK